MKKIFSIVFQVLVLLIYLLSALLFCVVGWIHDNLNVTLEQILSTVTGRVEGFSLSQTIDIRTQIKPIVIVLLLVLFIVLLRVLEKKAGKNGAKKGRIIFTAVIAALSAVLLIITGKRLDIVGMLESRSKVTTLYEDHYVVPDCSMISADKDTNNLIMIYMESMESSNADNANGGLSGDINYIPELTELAKSNISFSDGGAVGGLYCTSGANVTKSSLITTTSGAAEYQDPGTLESYYASAPSLGEILKDKGYSNYFLCGSDSTFEDMDKYLIEKGKYTIYDYYSSIRDGDISEDHKVWWGFEDEILYKIAREKLTEIAGKGEKFNFTIQTIDTHFPDGYVCGLCDDKYEDQYQNVYDCADRQISEFIEWCSGQPWYDHTTIVIMGDHPTFDITSFSSVPSSQRTVYNCFIHSLADPVQSSKSRTATTQDMFPSVLAAMGFKVKGGRLGLGTDLFCNKETLSEQMGYSVFNENMGMRSEYCTENFTKEDPVPESRTRAPKWLEDYLREHYPDLMKEMES